MNAESKIAGDRISAAQLDAACSAIYVEHDGYWPNASEIAHIQTALNAYAAEFWGEAEAATSALRDLLECAEHAATPRSQYAAMSDAIAAARALVGSENRKADDMDEKRHARSEAGFIEPIKVADSVPSEIPQAAIAPQAASSTFKMDDPYGSERGVADQLAAALRQLVEVIDGPPITDATEVNCDVAMDDARSVLDDYDAARGSSVRTQESASEAK